MACAVLARMREEARALGLRVLAFRKQGYHASADVLSDRLDRLNAAIETAEKREIREMRRVGKVLVTPSIQSQFETQTRKNAPESLSIGRPV